MFVVNACAMRCVRHAIWIRFRLARLPQSGRKKGEHMPHVVTKSDLVQVAAKASNLSKSAAGDALNAVFEAIVANAASGKEIKIRAKTIPAFAAGQGFKEAVDK